MMVVIGDDPVLWVDVATRKDHGYYADVNMQGWNRELEAVLADVPTVKIYHWSSDVQDEWFVSDGIHYNSRGLLARASLIPAALREQFPDPLSSGGIKHDGDVAHPSSIAPGGTE